MEKVRSKDGTSIAYWATGSGPSLLLVHGTTADHTRWTPILPAFQERFRVYTVDRRGRGESGDNDPYSLEREFEDIAAVIDCLPGPVHVLGHSHGAICSLEAALRTDNIARLILYEPPIFTGTPIYPPGVLERIQSMVDSGDREGAISTFFREVVRMPEAELQMFRSLPAWKARVEAAHTTSREIIMNGRYRFQPERFRDLSLPTLLLVGGDSPEFFKRAIDLLHKSLKESRIVSMPGQQHAAMNTAPELFTRNVMAFLEEGKDSPPRG